MKSNILILLVITGLISLKSYSQNDIITLENCFSSALINDPAYRQNEVLQTINSLKNKSLNKNYLPQINLNGQATYQSDVTEIALDFSKIKITPSIPGVSISGPEMPSVSNENYKATLDFNQVIYDGGLTRNQKQLENISYLIDKQHTEIEFLKLKQQISQIYFGIILLKENKELFLLMKEDLGNRLKRVESGIRNGTHIPSSAAVLKVETMKIEQQIAEIEINIVTYYKNLAQLTGLKITPETKLQTPKPVLNYEIFSNQRPEYSLYSMQAQKISASKGLLFSKNYPKIIGFGQAGYGKPGLNMFSDEFGTYYIIGANLSWKLWDWRQNHIERQVLDLQGNIIQYQKESFDRNMKILYDQNLSTVIKYDEIIKFDREIIKLRTSIKETAASQLENGTITASEYITELNAETQAKLAMKSHEIQQLKAKIACLMDMGL